MSEWWESNFQKIHRSWLAHLSGTGSQCDSAQFAVACVWRWANWWWQERELRRPGGLRIGDSAAPLTHMSYISSSIQITSKFCGCPYKLGWPKTYQISKKNVRIVDMFDSWCTPLSLTLCEQKRKAGCHSVNTNTLLCSPGQNNINHYSPNHNHLNNVHSHK